MVDIHEFSTGIKAEIRSDGSWISLGFTGNYMNSTLASIPHEVSTAINNKLFSIEKILDNQPAIIARILETWCVVAIISKGKDDFDRNVEVYRYFLSEDTNSLWTILRLIKRVKDKYGIFPIFNPSHQRLVGKPTPCKPEKSPFGQVDNQTQQWLNSQSFPILIKPKKNYDLQTINYWASAKANAINQKISWAYNIEILSKPQEFILIQPATDEAFNRLKQTIFTPNISSSNDNRSNNKSNNENDGGSNNFKFRDIENAIDNLIQDNRISHQAIDIIAKALENKEINIQNWQKIFNKKGANMAIYNEIANEKIAKLLSIRAMIIPNTIKEFLSWLNKKDNQCFQNKSREFQLEFIEKFPKKQEELLEKKLMAGLNIMLPKLLKEEITPQYFTILLTGGGAWVTVKNHLIDQIKIDLEMIGEEGSEVDRKALNFGEIIWLKLIQEWDDLPEKPISYYKPFADLFYLIFEYKLAAYFCQVSYNYVMAEIFREANFKNKEVNLYGLTLKQKKKFFW